MILTGNLVKQYIRRTAEMTARKTDIPNVDALLNELAQACEGDDAVSAMPLYATVVPGVCMFNNSHSQSILMTSQQRGVRNRSQELLNKIAFGLVEPVVAAEVLNIDTLAMYDTQTGNIFYAIHQTKKTPEGKYAGVSGLGVCVTEGLVSERRRDFVADAALQLDIADRNRQVYDLLVVSLAAGSMSANFPEGVAAFGTAMHQAHNQMLEEAEKGEFDVGDMPDAVYTFDMMDFAIFSADITLAGYSLMAQGGDLAQQGYDVSEFQTVYQNIYESGAVVDLFNDIVFCVVEQPEDMVARCHGIVARAVNMRETINALCETYDNVAALKEEADKAVMH